MKEQDLRKLLIDLASKPKESEWVEFKVNNFNPQEVGEYISALSNSACYHKQPFAYLVFGVEDKTHVLAGTNFRPSLEKKGNQELENWLATQLNPRIDFNIFEFTYENKHFVIIKISATRNTPVSFRGESFIRIGSYKKPLDDHPEKERIIWNKENNFTFEKVIAKSSLSEFDVLDLIDYTGYFDLIKFPLPDNRKAILERLEQDKVVVKNLEVYEITNLGAILFSKDIERFEKLDRKAVRVIIYDGNNKYITQKEQIGKKGYAVGFEELLKYITDQLPSKELIKNGRREIFTFYPPLALRELVANAIIHQDFTVSGAGPMIEIFNNRIEITNPGKPLIDTRRFIDHSPESRNEILARYMRRLNICEERGSGIDKVILECEFNQLPAPDFIVGDNFTRVIMYGNKSIREMDKQDKIRACYLHASIKYVSGEYMTNQSLRERFGIEEHNYSTVSRIIADTIKSELIKDFDPGNKSKKYAKYMPYWV